MPAVRPSSASCTASPTAGATGMSTRIRSASPSRRALAIDMRRIASLLRDPPVGGDAGSVNTSICSSPHSAWEPGDRGAAPIGAHATAQRMALQSQFSALTEKVNVVIAGLQRQCDADRRRVAQLERKVETRLEDDSRKNDGREKWAEIQGSVTGLLEETQALTRRVEGLDERLWARTSGSELTKQRHRELEQQVQALEQQSRLQAAATEETQKRQATKLRRSEHTLEELSRRISKAEDDMRSRGSGPQQGYLEQRFTVIEQNQEQFDADLRALQEQLDEGLQAVGDNQADDPAAHEIGPHHLEEAVQNVERGLSALEKKVSSQVEELASNHASLKVKADGQSNRVHSLLERLETAHEPAIDSLRAEINQAIQQHRRDWEGEVGALRSRLQETSDGHEESVAEVREHIRHTKAEMAALSLRPEENPAHRILEDRMDGHEREVRELHARFDAIPLATEQALGDDGTGDKLPDDWEDLRRRLEWLEEQGAAGAAVDTVDQRQVQQMQDSIIDMHEQVSNIKQRASSGDAASTALQQQVQQLQVMIERRQSEDSGSMRDFSKVEAKVDAISQQVAHIDARLLEVEGGLEFARENETSPLVEVSAVSVQSEVPSNAPGRALPPLPRGEVERDRAGPGDGARSGVGQLEAKLEVVADHLEVIDELAERVAELEQRLSVGGGAPGGGTSEEMAAEQVSFGPPAGGQPVYTNLTREVDNLRAEVDEMRKRLLEAERGLGKLEDTEDDPGPGRGSNDEVQAISERMAILEEKMSSTEGLHPKLDRRIDELSTHIKGLSEDMQTHSRRVDEMDDVDSRLASAEDALEELKDSLDQKKPDQGKDDHVASLRNSITEALDHSRGVQKEVAELRETEASRRIASDKSLLSRISAVEDKVGDEHWSSHVQAQVTPLKTELAKQLERLNGHDKELAETKASLGSLSEQMASLKERGTQDTTSNEAIDSAALAEVRRDIAETRARLDGNAKSTAEMDALSEVRKDIADTKATLDGRVQEVETAHSRLQATQDEHAKIKEEVAKLREEVSKQEAFKEEVSKLRDKVFRHDGFTEDLDEMKETFGSRVGRVEQAHARLQAAQDEHGKLAPQLEELKNDLSKLQAKPDSHERGLPDVQALKDEVSKLRERPSTDEHTKLATELQDVKASVLKAETEISALRQAASAEEKAAELAEERARVAGELAERLRIIEERLGEGTFGNNTCSPVGDEQARSQVEDQVQKLTSQVCSELTSLAEHQADLAGARETLKALASQVAAGGGASAEVAASSPSMKSAAPALEAKLKDVAGRLDKFEQRIEAVEETGKTLRHDVEELQDLSSLDEVRDQLAELRGKVMDKQGQGNASVRKVGIGMGGEDPASSPSAFWQSKLQGLEEQVADLQCQVRDGSGSVSGGASKGADTKDGSLNFSLTGERGGSLNYSLTEQSRRSFQVGRGSRGNSPSNSSGSIDVDLPEADDIPVTKGRVGLAGAGSGDVLDSLVSAPSGGGSDALDSLVGGGRSGKTGGGSSDALDSLVGGSSGSKKSEKDRPRPPALNFDEEHSGHLPSVAEEESADLEVDESAHIAPGSASGSGSTGIAGRARNTPKSVRGSPASVAESPSGGNILEASLTANEVSVGVDHSVEDSLDLERECDHWETVEPCSTKARASADRAAGGASGDTATASPSVAAKTASPSKAQSPKVAVDAIDALMGPSKSAMAPMASSPTGRAAGSAGIAGAASGAKAAAKEEDDDAYGNESFDNDDMSVPESIEESLEDSDSNAWGKDEDV